MFQQNRLDLDKTKQQFEKTTSSSKSKQLTSHRTKPQAKVTIVGTDRTTFASALSMAVRQYVSEIVIFDQCYNRQMKMCVHDLACAFQLCRFSRSIKLIYTSDVAYTSNSDVILITGMQSHKRSLKEKAEELIDRLRGVRPYDYNALVVKSLAGNRCRAGQICGLGSNIYNYRLRLAISELLDIPSKHITGFTLSNNTKSIEPYWPSVTVNGQAIILNDSKTEDYTDNQSISNNAQQIEHRSIKTNRMKNNQTVIGHKPNKNTSVLYINNKTSIRIQDWLRSSTLLRSIKSRTLFKNNRAIIKRVQRYQNTKTHISNNAITITKSRHPIQDQLIKHLNTWHCLQALYHHPCDYTLGMNLSQVSRAIMSNSQEILILSTHLESFLKRQSTNQVIECKNKNLFANVPVVVRRYGIHAVLNFKSQVELYNRVDTIIEHNRIFRDMMNYPVEKTQLIYDLKTK